MSLGGSVVIDASALVKATTETDPGAAELRRLLATTVCHAPHLIDAEFGNVLRRKVRRGEMTANHAEAVLRAAPALIDYRHEHEALAGEAWRLRDNVTFTTGFMWHSPPGSALCSSPMTRHWRPHQVCPARCA
ncbi:MAG TPA: type II toxin-antitoxin system VapC family toxin [Micromonosporaceae bacterium]|nr:type II toxin-antitoxin system VapC family toxin [Micromonosporaceae bacterium]